MTSTSIEYRFSYPTDKASNCLFLSKADRRLVLSLYLVHVQDPEIKDLPLIVMLEDGLGEFH